MRAPVWVPDQGDGTYRNPVLFADYSDPDVVRVGTDYYLVASSFSCAPGLPLLHSNDLVNWRIIGHVFSRQLPAAHFAVPRHGGGAWAPSIRHHDGQFWIYYPDPDFGLHVCTASDPAGRWSPAAPVKAGKGFIDPCPFWDDDGQGYLVHGWAKSRSGLNNILTLNRLSPDGRAVLDKGEVVIDGNRLSGWHTLEGPKFYKRRGWYYLFAPAGGVATGYQAVFRSRSIYGPYEPRVVLEQGSTPINGPHQGAWVDTPNGQHWFLHFQDRGPFGRVVHLQPMVWGEDDWPVIGSKGEPVTAHAKPSLGRSGPAEVPQASDDFAGGKLGLQWQWQANPSPDWSSFIRRPAGGFTLRLPCVPSPAGANLWGAGHLLLQKFAGPAFTATAALRFSPSIEGDRAGLIVFGADYAWIGLCQTARGLRLVQRMCPAAAKLAPETEVASQPVGSGPVYVRVGVDSAAKCQFSWSADGIGFSKLGAPFQAVPGIWVGAKVGLFAATDAPEIRGFLECDGMSFER